MDGKYVKYFKNQKGFITGIEIVNDEIHVYTAASKKGEPEIFPIKEKLPEYSQTLETQYRLITPEETAKMIKKDLMQTVKEKVNIMTTVGVVSLAVAAGVTLALDIIALPAITGLCILLSLVLRNITLKNKSKSIDNETDMIRTYLDYRHDIETEYKQNQNVTRYLSDTTKHRITINEEYKQDKLIEDVFDIILMDELLDKKKLKDLRTLLNHYIIGKSLEQPQAIINPENNNQSSQTKSKPKKRKKQKQQ